MKGPSLAVLATMLLALAPAAAQACGACDEDKIAATYDHAVVRRAAASGDVMVYCAISGPFDDERLKRAASGVHGVRPDSVRVAAQPAALSFAVDPTVQSPQAAIELAQSALPSNLHLTLVRLVMPAPARVIGRRLR
ncbi:MAG: hypothetical protein ACT4QA_22800 [Panacagrimonas sp.]